MTPEQAIAEAEKGKLRPVYLVVGEERHLSQAVTSGLRKAALRGGVEGLNDDTMDAPSATVDQVLQTAKTLPMLAQRRFVLCRNIENWESEKKAKKSSRTVGPLDRLCAYAEHADPMTVLVLVAAKLDKRRRLYTSAKKAGYLVNCESPKRHELPDWIVEQANAHGNPIARSVADLIAELAGPQLSAVADALQRVSLYVGADQPITEEAVSECVVRLRTATVWELVASVGNRDLGNCLSLLQDVYDPQDRGLRLIGVLGWATRQLIRFEEALREGGSPQQAAQAAGAPPFKARALSEQLKTMPKGALNSWLSSLAEADRALKGGSRRPPLAVIEQMLMDLCRAA